MSTRHIRDSEAVPTYQPMVVEEATIANSPDSPGDDLFVILASGSHQQRVGPVRGWQPHHLDGDDVMPSRGDSALVARGATAYWLLTWEA